MPFQCEQGHNNHKTASSASMCNAAAKTARMDAERLSAGVSTSAGLAAKRGGPIPKPGESRRGKKVDAGRALARNAGADDVDEATDVVAADVVKPQTGGGSKKKEESPKIPHGLSEAAVRAFARVYKGGTLAEPLFRADLQKAERRVLRGDCKKDKVIVHERVADDEGVEKSAFYFDVRFTDKAMVAKYIEAYESEAVAGKALGQPKSTGKEERPAVKAKEKAAAKKSEAEGTTGGQTDAERAVVEEAMKSDDAAAGGNGKGASKKGASKKGARKGAAAEQSA